MESSFFRRASANGPGAHPARLSRGVAAIGAALLLALSPAQAAERTATFAGGCFWCVEADFDKVPGVLETVSGFTGGTLKNPTYNGNHRGHYEAVEITFDDSQVTYEELLKVFWRHIDPLDDGGQFCDRGFSYKTAIFVHDEAQERAAEASRAEVVTLFPDAEVATVVLPAKAFWPVEEYHQNYATKNPLRYKYYRWNCGRDQRVDALWGDKDWGSDTVAH
jgi:peptide-methionine (S)-S-oxide reductase